ncbi:MAG TPA: LysE/ArgO family amino acid transporter [Beijerinckiaceae bacterium]|nr:LysE/ArgO family amino acid transporter [Beijerinckiaceae bacterium]
MLSAAIAGFLLGGSLIVAIGAQNAFVLRQGLLRHNVFAVTLFCAVSDAVLIALGVAGFGAYVASSPGLLRIVGIAGAAFLFAYGGMAFRRALQPSVLTATEAPAPPLATALASCASFTFLNPHVYLDTVVLVGGLAATWPGSSRYVFGAGAILASFVWFFGLGYGARLLEPVFRSPRAWQVLDCLIGLIMWMLAARIALPLF